MPCQGGPSYSPETDYRTWKGRLDELTVEADQLRELVIAFVEGDTPEVPQKLLNLIKRRQTAHRKEDLERLEKTFIASKDTERLAKVWAASPKRPLEPQLGFNPDSF
jgi:hypothetical protein